MNKLVSIATGVIKNEDINVHSAVDIGTKIAFGLHDKKLGEISIKKTEPSKNICKNKKICKSWRNRGPNASYQLNQRLLASVVRDEAPLLTIFSHELSGVTPSWFHDNGEMRKNKAGLMNDISSILIDVLTESALSAASELSLTGPLGSTVFSGWKSVTFRKCIVLLTECGTNVDQISVPFDGCIVESAKGPEQFLYPL